MIASRLYRRPTKFGLQTATALAYPAEPEKPGSAGPFIATSKNFNFSLDPEPMLG